MKTVKHHSFTLWFHSCEDQCEKVPVLVFDEDESFETVLLTMLSFDEFGILTSLTCDTWSTSENDDDMEIVK